MVMGAYECDRLDFVTSYQCHNIHCLFSYNFFSTLIPFISKEVDHAKKPFRQLFRKAAKLYKKYVHTI